MTPILVKRKVFWTVEDAAGKPQPNKKTTFEVIKDVFANGLVIPQEKVEVFSSNDPAHLGECEVELYTVKYYDPETDTTTDSFLNYRATLHNGNPYRLPVAPGADISLDALMNSALAQPPETPEESLEFEFAMQSIAAQAVTVHEGKADPHSQYFNQTRGDLRYARLTDIAAIVRGTLLTGISFVSSLAITANDNLLGALGKLQAQLNRIYEFINRDDETDTVDITGAEVQINGKKIEELARDAAGMYDNQNVIIGANTPKDRANIFSRNVYVGFSSGNQATADTTHNVAVGSYTLWWHVLGVLNSAFGTDVLSYLEEGGWNTAWGAKALRYLIYGNHNTAGGHNSFANLLEGNRNTGLGQGSGNSQLYGNENIFVGYLAGKFSRDGNGNIVVGNNSGFSVFITNSASNNVLIGNNIDADPTKSNFLNICNVIKADIGYPKGMGFFGSEPVAKPVVKDIPTLISALASLGLIDNQVTDNRLIDLFLTYDISGGTPLVANDTIISGGTV